MSNDDLESGDSDPFMTEEEHVEATGEGGPSGSSPVRALLHDSPHTDLEEGLDFAPDPENGGVPRILRGLNKIADYYTGEDVMKSAAVDIVIGVVELGMDDGEESDARGGGDGGGEDGGYIPHEEVTEEVYDGPVRAGS